MNKSVLTALIVMPAIVASSFVGVTFANNTSTDSSSVKSTSTQKHTRNNIKNSQGNYKMGMPMMHSMQSLTDDEKKSLESMTATQKKEFFQKKMDEQKAKMDARDAVIDKLLNGESLSDADKIIVTEIKAERVKMKAERTQMDAIRAKLDKNEALTTEEQTLLDTHKPNGHHGKIMKEREVTEK